MMSIMGNKRTGLSVLRTVWLILFMGAGICLSQGRTRHEVKIPDIPGYTTLKCDFHMHTVFSDGNVWPSVRSEEAWREGLDAFSITDHLEYQPHKNDVRTDHNRSYVLAKPSADAFGLLIIRGAEITRNMPPGHLNAIFLSDAGLLDREEFFDAVKGAIDQDGFVIWNHPGWTGQQPDGVSRWYEEHSRLLEKGWLHGIEVVNGSSYYPEVHRWCLEKKLTLIGTSDVHDPIHFGYHFSAGKHRPMTLAFVEEISEDGLRDALFARRTAVYWKDVLIGEEKFIKPIFERSVEILNPSVHVTGNGRAGIRIRNTSQVPFKLVAEKVSEGVTGPDKITLHPDATVILGIRIKAGNTDPDGDIRLGYRVDNLWTTPEERLSVEFSVRVQTDKD